MRAIFEVKDEQIGDTTFSPVTRTYYKARIEDIDRRGHAFTVGTEYRDGNPVKMLTIKKKLP